MVSGGIVGGLRFVEAVGPSWRFTGLQKKGSVGAMNHRVKSASSIIVRGAEREGFPAQKRG